MTDVVIFCLFYGLFVYTNFLPFINWIKWRIAVLLVCSNLTDF